jgi:vacuolar protein sorting-associated protein 13A/C
MTQDDDGAKQRYPQRQVNARSEADYAWDYPTAPNRRIQLSCDGVPLPRNIDMMAIGIQPPLKIPVRHLPGEDCITLTVQGGPQTANRNTGQRSSMISTDIQADGNSQLLVISHYDPETSVYKPAKRGAGAIKRSDSTDSITTASFETVAISDKPNVTITVELEGIGLSVITKSAAELFYLSLRGLKLAYSDYPTYYEANLDLKWIQIDNQLFGGLFPIILYPTVIPKDGKELESHPTLQTTVAVLKDQCRFYDSTTSA